MMNLLIAVHAVFILGVSGTGVSVLRGLLIDGLTCKRLVRFLRITLVCDVLGVLFSFDGHLWSVRPLSMISVFMTGIVVVAWRLGHLKGIWRAVFSSVLTFIFGINIQIAIYRLLKCVLPLMATSASKQYELLFTLENIMVLASLLSAVAVTVHFRARQE